MERGDMKAKFPQDYSLVLRTQVEVSKSHASELMGTYHISNVVLVSADWAKENNIKIDHKP